jgi:putative ABC transport system permease protein
MLLNIITVALRTFLRHGFYTGINVIGLSSGLACVVLIYLWVADEIHKDEFHQDSKQLYHIISNLKLEDGQIITWANTPGPLADDIREHVPGVEFASRTQSANKHIFKYQDKSFYENGLYADPDFFNMFDFKIISGSTSPLGLDKSSVAISKSLANKLFGTSDPIGLVINVEQKYDVEVKTVFEDVGPNSSLNFDFILPFEIVRDRSGQSFNWFNFRYPLYLKLSENSNAEEAAKIINARLPEAKESDGPEIEFYLQPFTDRYLYSKFENGRPVGGRIQYVHLFSMVAIFILLVACINFMNMTTAKGTTRAKEVGVRKVIGAQRASLIKQFIFESLALSALAMTIALAIVYLVLPLFNTLVVKELSLNIFNLENSLSILTIILITGILAGSYPAFFLSAFNPLAVLKGNTGSMLSGSSLRKVLVTFQFSLTVILGASTLIIYQQIEFIRNKNIGYNRNNVLTFPAYSGIAGAYESFRNEAIQLKGIQLVSLADNSLVEVTNQNSSVTWPGRPEKETILFRTVQVDYDFLETMELKLLEGRLFQREFADSNNFVVTKSAVEIMGLDIPIGQKITQGDSEGTIVGVVDDFHSRSVHQAIDPVIFFHQPQHANRVFVRYEGNQTTAVIEQLANLYKKYNPEYPFHFSFLDEDFEKLYNNEKVISTLAFLFTVMTIIISSLGLVGLAAYTIERRKKEVGIRKILGASATTIVSLLSKDFLKLSFMSALIGCPVAYYIMDNFLQEYQYRVELNWSVFMAVALFVIIITMLTISGVALKAALTNPTQTLRSE